MPLINNSDFEISEISEILADTPELRSFQELEELKRQEKKELSAISRILNQNNGSIEKASEVIAEIMHSSKFDNTRIKAAEIILDLHEVRNKDGQINKQPIINFNIISDEVRIANIFAPKRS